MSSPPPPQRDGLLATVVCPLALLAVVLQPLVALANIASPLPGSVHTRILYTWFAAVVLLPPVILGCLVAPKARLWFAPSWRVFCHAFVILNLIHLAVLQHGYEALNYPLRNAPAEATTLRPVIFGFLAVGPLVFGILASFASRMAVRMRTEPAPPSPGAAGPVSEAGFSLLDLLLVIAYISTLVAFVLGLPGPLRSNIASNEMHATATLHQLVSVESTWRMTDADGNGAADFWALDVAGFYAARGPSGTPINFVQASLAMADLRPATVLSGQPKQPSAERGYLFCAMQFDENGSPYAITPVTLPAAAVPPGGQAKISACNTGKYAFCAVPEKYDYTGIRTVIVNQDGVLYYVDTGSNTPILRWPGKDPTACTVNGRTWGVVD